MAAVCNTPGTEETYLSGEYQITMFLMKHLKNLKSLEESNLTTQWAFTKLRVPRFWFSPMVCSMVGSLFTVLLALDDICEVGQAGAWKKWCSKGKEEFGKAITTYLACAVDRSADFGSTLHLELWQRNFTYIFSASFTDGLGLAESDPFNPLRC